MTMMNTTIAQLRELKLAGFALALEEQLGAAGSAALSFEERLALLVDRELHHRNDRRQALLLKKARLKYAQACIEDLDTRAGRGIERGAIIGLALSRWVDQGLTISINGLTGTPATICPCRSGR